MRLELDVDRTDLVRFLDAGKRAIPRLVGAAAEQLSDELRDESASASRRVAESWRVEPAPRALERTVVSDQFIAGFLARGTKGHGPRSAPHMVFSVAGDLVFASFVEGISPDPFDQRAMRTVEGRVDDIVARLIAEVR